MSYFFLIFSGTRSTAPYAPPVWAHIDEECQRIDYCSDCFLDDSIQKGKSFYWFSSSYRPIRSLRSNLGSPTVLRVHFESLMKQVFPVMILLPLFWFNEEEKWLTRARHSCANFKSSKGSRVPMTKYDPKQKIDFVLQRRTRINLQCMIIIGFFQRGFWKDLHQGFEDYRQLPYQDCICLKSQASLLKGDNTCAQ